MTSRRSETQVWEWNVFYLLLNDSSSQWNTGVRMKRVLPVAQWQHVAVTLAVQGLGVHVAAVTPAELVFYSDKHWAVQAPAVTAAAAQTPR